MKMTTLRSLVAALLLAGAALPIATEDASACAILPVGSDVRPSIALERVAILFEESQKIEHFIREVRFDYASEAFAFVVPTPAKPEVAAVDSKVIEDLAHAFPLEPPSRDITAVEGSKSAGVEGDRGVTVLEVTKVGSFTAFVLAADDTAALDKWLTDNRITLPSGGREWLNHYVRLRFFFTAFRYEAQVKAAAPTALPTSSDQFASPPRDDGAAPPDPEENPAPTHVSMTSETVRLSFRTAVPFYPYLEPAHDPNDIISRMMMVWLVSREERAPTVRRYARGNAPRWGFPWQAELEYEKDAEDVLRPLGEQRSLLTGGGRYHVQTFSDVRPNRDGWSDILFPVGSKVDDGPEWRSTATSLLGDLERGLHTGVASPDEVDNEAKFRIPPGGRGCGCRLAEDEDTDSSVGWLVLGGIAVLAARRARIRF